MKLSLKSKVRQSNKVISHEFERAIYILDPHKNTVRMLNNTAGFIWNSIDKWQTVATVADKLTNQFKVSRRKAEDDVLRFLSKFAKLNYISDNISATRPTDG